MYTYIFNCTFLSQILYSHFGKIPVFVPSSRAIIEDSSALSALTLPSFGLLQLLCALFSSIYASQAFFEPLPFVSLLFFRLSLTHFRRKFRRFLLVQAFFKPFVSCKLCVIRLTLAFISTDICFVCPYSTIYFLHVIIFCCTKFTGRLVPNSLKGLCFESH